MAKDGNYWQDKYWPRLLRRRLNRRRLMQLTGVGVVGAITAAYLGCEDGGPTKTPTPGATVTAPTPSPVTAVTPTLSGIPAFSGTDTPGNPGVPHDAVIPTDLPPTTKDTLVVASPTTTVSWDRDYPFAGEPSWSVVGNVNEYLVEHHIVPGDTPGTFVADVLDPAFQGRLAMEWALSEDGTVATFKLRPGVMSEHGNEITADDVVYSWERANEFPVGQFFNLISDFKEAKKIDASTVQIITSKPNPLVVTMKANLYQSINDSATLNANSTSDDPWAAEWLATHSAGFGAYSVPEHAPGTRTVFEANPNYYRGEARIKRITWSAVPTSANRKSLIERGEVDMATQLAPRDFMALEGKEGIKLVNIKSNYEIYAVMDNSQPPFDKKEVRQAMQYALPQQQIIDSVYQGLADPWKGAYPNIFPGYTEDFWVYDFDPQKAKQLLEAGGYADGFDITLSFDSSEADQEEVAVIWRTELARLGVNVTLDKAPPAEYQQKMVSAQYQFALRRDTPIEPDPGYQLWLAYNEGGYNNYGHYVNPDVTRLTDELVTILDFDQRVAKSKEIQRLIMEDVPWAFVVAPNYQVAMRENLQGFTWYNTENFRFWDLYFS